MTSDFDKYIKDYKKNIDRVAGLTGEEFEYFIELRIKLIESKLKDKLEDKSVMKILDFGCGIGITEVFLNERFPKARIYGVDISKECIKTGKKMCLENVNFITLEGSRLPFDDDYFDLIYSNGVFHHIDPKLHQGIVQELFRVLKSKGDLFIFENNPHNPLMRKAMKNNPMDDDSIYVYPKELKKLVTDAGFSQCETNFYIFYPKYFKFLRATEKYLCRVPLGAQYFVRGFSKD